MITLSKSSWPSKFLLNYPITPLRLYRPWNMGFCPFMRAILWRMLLLVSLVPFPAALVYEFCTMWHDATPGANSFFEVFRFCLATITIITILAWLVIWYILPWTTKAVKATGSAISNAMPARSTRTDKTKKMTKRERIWAETDRRYYAALIEWNAAYEAWAKKDDNSPAPQAPDWSLIYAQVTDEQRSGFAKMLLTFADSLKRGLCPTVNWVD